MPTTIANKPIDGHRVISDVQPKAAKASLRKADMPEWNAAIGGCLDAARREIGWTLEQLSAELQRDARQVARWIRGEERTQLDVVFSVEVLREPFVVALAKLAGTFVIETVLRRRSA